jgi:hypothetical protein
MPKELKEARCNHDGCYASYDHFHILLHNYLITIIQNCLSVHYWRITDKTFCYHTHTGG